MSSEAALKSLERDTQAAPVIRMVQDMASSLRKAGRPTFDGKKPWENALCALILSLDPRCRTYALLESLPSGDMALDCADVLNAMSHLGYSGRHVDIALQDIDSRLLPCLFISEKGNPAIILSHDGEFLTVYKNGDVRNIRTKRGGKISGSAWIFERFDENKAPTSKFMRAGSGYKWFRALLGRFRATFGQVLVTGLVLNLIALATPLYIMVVYDRVIAAGSPATLPMLVVGVCTAILFEWILRRIRSRGLSWLSARMDNIVSNRIFSHLIGLPPALIERASVAAQIARIKTFESVRDFFSGAVFLSMMEIPFVFLAAAAIFAIAGPLVFVPLAMLGLYGFLYYVAYRRVRVSIRLAAKASSARQQFSIETFEKIKGVRSYGLSRIWQSKFRELSGREMLAHFHLNWTGMVAETCAHALTLVSAVATIGFGIHLVWAGAMSTGALVASMILVWRILTPFYSLCTMIPRLEQIRNSIAQVNMLMDLDTEAVEAKTAARLSKMKGRVTFSHVELSYIEDSDPVFSNLSFMAIPGEIVAVTGENGSGKTSLLKLIKGLYHATGGSVQVDGFDIRQLDAPDLRRQIAYVPQQSDFFHGSVIENLRMGNPLATVDDVQGALQLADAWDEVMQMPDGLDTVISRYGDKAPPAGLATRLSLARAYLHNAPVLLIDELPNALLSGRAGKNLKDYLSRIHGRRTVIMVTYREDFMAMADTVVFLRRGETPVAGSREDISATPFPHDKSNKMEVA